RPKHTREIALQRALRRGADVMRGKRPLELLPRTNVIAFEPAGQATHPPSRCLPLRIPPQSLRPSTHGRQFAADPTAAPPAGNGQKFGRGVLADLSELAGAVERGGRFWCAVASRRLQCLTVRELQPQPEEALRRSLGHVVGKL